MTAAPDWLVVERGEAPLIVSIPHAGTELARIRAALRQPLAGAQGRGLVDRRALRLRRARSARRSCAPRFRARSSTSTAIPAAPRSIPARRRPNCARRRPSTASRSIGRARRPTRPRSPSGGGAISIPTTRALARRDRAAARTLSARRAVRRPFDPLARPAPVRGRAAAVQPRHQFGQELRSRACARRSARFSPPAARAASSTAASRAAGSPASTAAPSDGVARAADWSSPAAPICRSRTSLDEANWPAPLDPARADKTRATLRKALETMLALLAIARTPRPSPCLSRERGEDGAARPLPLAGEAGEGRMPRLRRMSEPA